MMVHTAQLSNSGGRWRLYVVVLEGRVSQWPEYDFGPTAAVPTVAERSRALAGLGFVFTDGAEWEWTEYSETHGDDTSPVRLLASVLVCSRDGGTS
ncbi:DUF6303 family protein [Streptomyces sp. NBC_01500]|uniref:DUF6303 family protein n=1 Tax=Streptomyces sp. NBC_01500 TaxID=2903886 RepID=UPI002258DB65|nr:DUF6303 family protein [Streptomyces sp. NBC_01500]MCX4549454.1 DUF6303 family protein [Streptomyces sp. NBC_01500]